tara:strand:+ start:167 stop:439 length:273 start_codon:yes stop_codon:yes gene_type:complete
MNLKIKENMLISLKVKTWYYETSDIKKRRKDGYPAGGFLDRGEHLLVCEIKKRKKGVLKIKALHRTKNNVYIIFEKGNESYFFEAINTCN